MGHQLEVYTINLVVASLMAFFALFEIVPKLKSIQFDKNKLSFGGMISGFFGGLSGHQGALRSAFLIRYGLSKDVFIARKNEIFLNMKPELKTKLDLNPPDDQTSAKMEAIRDAMIYVK